MTTAKTKFGGIRWILICAAALIVAGLSVLLAHNSDNDKPAFKSEGKIVAPAPPNIDKQAAKILKSMSDYLTGLKEFTFTSNGYYEFVIDSLKQKIQVNNNGKMFFKRPDKFKAERTGEMTDVELFCDGKKLTVYGKKLKYYAQEPVSANIDQTLDYGRDVLNIETPAADLLYSNPEKGLLEDVISGVYVGTGIAGGKKCHHLAFRGNETDWQIWIEDGPTPLPRKYVITSKKIETAPEYSIEIPEWKTDVKLNDKMFAFTPPAGATKIEFMKSNVAVESKTDNK